MSWAISTHGIECIDCLNQAAKVWDNAKPWRSEDISWRPLDNPRMRHKRIVKLSDDHGYECVLYKTPLVTYLADGSVLLRCHNSQSSQSFAHCVAPQGCAPLSHKGCMYWKVHTDHGDHYYLEGRTPLHLEKTTKGNWKLSSAAAELTEQAFDARKGAAARKIFKTYNTWYEISQRMGVNPGLKPCRYPHFKETTRLHLNALHMTPADPEVFVAAAPFLGAPDNARQLAYAHFGAVYQRTVPPDSLPRN